MTVQELIEKLKAAPMDAEVMVWKDDGDGEDYADPLLDIVVQDKEVWLNS